MRILPDAAGTARFAKLRRISGLGGPVCDRAGSYFCSAQASPDQFILVDESDPEPGPLLRLTNEEMRTLANDTQLDSAIAIPDWLLLPLASNLSVLQEAFINSVLLVRICDICRNSNHAYRETAETFMTRVINLRCNGSKAQFESVESTELRQATLEVAGRIRQEVFAQGA